MSDAINTPIAIVRRVADVNVLPSQLSLLLYDACKHVLPYLLCCLQTSKLHTHSFQTVFFLVDNANLVDITQSG